jgi:hypothetical protein
VNASSTLRGLGIAVAALGALAGLTLLVVKVMIPNVVGSGQYAAQQAAVSQLRTLLWAEDRYLELKAADRDQDGKGEYGFIAELADRAKVKGQLELQIPLIEGTLGHVVPGGEQGVSIYAAYCYRIFLPAVGGGAAAELPGGGEAPGTVDPDGAERSWIAYAWPVRQGEGGTKVFYINQDEEIWESDGRGARQGYTGPAHGPAFDAALPRPDLSALPVEGQPGGDGGLWKRWKHKKPRKQR